MIYLASLAGNEPDMYRHFFCDIESKVVYSTFYEKKNNSEFIVTADVKFDINTKRLYDLDVLYSSVAVTVPEFSEWYIYRNKGTFHFLIDKIEQLIFDKL